MLIYLLVAFLVSLVLVWTLLYLKSDRNKYTASSYYQLTIMLGSGGHTGEICQLLKKFNFQKIQTLHILITQTDKSSQHFFRNFVENNHPQNYLYILSKMKLHYLVRTNQVKQSYFSALLTVCRSLFTSFWLVVKQLVNSSHFIANGPGSCVPLYYIFFILKKLKISRTKLIFFESWCRVKNLSLTGKVIRPIVDQFVVHWPDLAAKYPSCKYYGKII